MIHHPAFGICGYSGSGKTTLIVELIRRLSERGLKVGVVKHDVHGLNVDREGKDSDRFFKAGADVLMRGRDELFLRAHQGDEAELETVLRLLGPHYDLLLLEGHKSTPLVDKVWLLKDDEERCPPEAVNVKRVLRRDEDRVGLVLQMVEDWLAAQWLSVPVYAGVLIGGESRRMGRPKHLLPASGGLTWVERIVSVAEPLAGQMVLLGKGEVPPSLQRLPALHDVEDKEGPLAGILAAMRWRPEVSWLFLSCDTPKLSEEALRWLLANRKPGVWAVLPRRADPGAVEPLPGWYDFRSRRLLEACRGPAALAGNAKVATPLIPRELAAAWTNVNSGSELEQEMPDCPAPPFPLGCGF